MKVKRGLEMRREKIVISLIVMLVISLMFTVNAFATGEPSVITTITTGNSTEKPASSGTPTTITPTNSGTVPLATESTTKAPVTNGATQISAGNITPVTNNAGNTTVTSSYRNLASNTNTDGLPYTGSSYGIVFVILALAISAVYAYKKVSDYNM